jgi:uncharacterized protein (TIGR03000 family)
MFRQKRHITALALLIASTVVMTPSPGGAAPPPGAGPSSNTGYSGVYQGGYSGATHNGFTGIYQGGYSGATHSGYEGVYQGGYPGDYYRDRGYTPYRGLYGFEPEYPSRSRVPQSAYARRSTPPSLETNRVAVEVRVPAGAELWFEGKRTSQTGAVRQFVSPPLTPGSTYAYQVRARWLENGQPVERSREIKVRAGERLTIDLRSPEE